MDDPQRRDIVSKGIAYKKSSTADDLYKEGEEMTFKEKFSLFTQKCQRQPSRYRDTDHCTGSPCALIYLGLLNIRRLDAGHHLKDR